MPSSPAEKQCGTSLPSSPLSSPLVSPSPSEKQRSQVLPSNCVDTPLWALCDAHRCVSSPVANRLSPTLRHSKGSEALLEEHCSPALPGSCVCSPVANRQSAHQSTISLESASVSDAESHMSRHRQKKSPESPSESSHESPQLRCSPNYVHPQGPHAKQDTRKPEYSASWHGGAKRSRHASMDQQSGAKRCATNGGKHSVHSAVIARSSELFQMSTFSPFMTPAVWQQHQCTLSPHPCCSHSSTLVE